MARTPTVQRGRIDLSDYNFKESGSVELYGEWEFYWNKLLTYNDFETSTHVPDYLKVPSSWKGQSINSQTNPLPGIGCATYKAHVILPKGSTDFSFKFLTFGTASTLFINGKAIVSSGKPGESEETTIPDFKSKIVHLEIDTTEFDIIIQTSNFNYRTGGAWKPLEIGPENIVRKHYEHNIFLDYFLLGVFFIIGLYHFGIFFIQRRNRSNLYYALGTIVVGLRSTATGEYIIGDFNIFSWDNIIRLELLTFFIAVGILGLFIQSIFPKDFHKKVLIVIASVSGLASAITLFTKPIFYSELVVYFQVFTAVCIAYFLYVTIRIIRKKRPGYVFFSIGILALCIFIAYDMLVTLEVIPPPQIAVVGFFFFMLLQSYVLAANFNSTYLLNEKLRSKLSDSNANLELKVEQRTSELKAANSVKDKFFSIISHDLGGPVNSTKNALGFIIDDLDSMDKGEIKSDLQVVHKSLKSAQSLLNDLLDWSRSQNNQIDLSPSFYSPSDMVETPLELLAESANKKNISIIKQFSRGHRAWVDLKTIQTVVRNIVANAIKFTPDNGTIEILSTIDATRFTLIIKDSGVGIPEDKIESLFEITRNKSTIGTSGEKGTGLGLILCKEFVDRNKGDIHVESEINKGTSFYIVLPIEPE